MRPAREFPVHPEVAALRKATVAAFLRGDASEHGRLARTLSDALAAHHPPSERPTEQLEEDGASRSRRLRERHRAARTDKKMRT